MVVWCVGVGEEEDVEHFRVGLTVNRNVQERFALLLIAYLHFSAFFKINLSSAKFKARLLMDCWGEKKKRAERSVSDLIDKTRPIRERERNLIGFAQPLIAKRADGIDRERGESRKLNPNLMSQVKTSVQHAALTLCCNYFHLLISIINFRRSLHFYSAPARKMQLRLGLRHESIRKS